MYWSRKFKISDCKKAENTPPCNYIGYNRRWRRSGQESTGMRHGINIDLNKYGQRHATVYKNIADCEDEKVGDKIIFKGWEKLRKHPRVMTNKEEMHAFKEKGSVSGFNYKDECSSLKRSCQLNRRNQPKRPDEYDTQANNNYSYSYNEFLRIKKMTYGKMLATKPVDTNNSTVGYGGDCGICENKGVTWKPNNKKYSVQGAVSSSSRLDRLKLDTIRGSKKCEDATKCGEKYFSGKPRYYGFNNGFVKGSLKENGNIEDKARGRARGSLRSSLRKCC